MKWTPKDVIACIIIVGLFLLKCLGHDSVLSWSLLGIIGAYYGINLTPVIRMGLHKKPDNDA